jgi:MFS family permease
MGEIVGLEKVLYRIDIGRYHIIAWLIFGLNYFSYGMSLTLSTLMPEVLPDVFTMSSWELGVLGGIFNFGFTIGTFGAAFEDVLGRRWFIRSGTLSMLFGTFASAFMPEFWGYCICRMFIGVGVGLYEIALVSFITEINPIHWRARFFVALNATYYFGAITLVALAFAMMPGLEPGHWRMLIGICGVFLIPVAVFCFTTLVESPRFLINKDRREEAIVAFNKICRSCKVDELTAEEVDIVHNEPKHGELEFQEAAKIVYTKYLKITLQFNYAWFTIGVCVYGILYLAPVALASQAADPLVFELIITAA